MHLRESETTHIAYAQALRDVLFFPDFKPSARGQEARECIEYGFTVLRPTSEAIRTQDPERNDVIAKYTAKEFVLYESMSRDGSDYAAASAFWGKLKNPDGTINSAYGWLAENRQCCGSDFEAGGAVMRTPWEWAKMSLLDDQDTRQAVVYYNTPEHAWRGNKDFVCTMHGMFLIRDGRLHLSMVMRSNDVVKGLVYDMPWFISRQEKMLAELQVTMPHLAMGSYSHLAHSMHIYATDVDKAKKMVGH